MKRSLKKIAVLILIINALCIESVFAKEYFTIHGVGLYSRFNKEGIFISDLTNGIFESSFALAKAYGTPYKSIFSMITEDGTEYKGTIDQDNYACDVYGVDALDDYYPCRIRASFHKNSSPYTSFKIIIVGKKDPSQSEGIFKTIEGRLPELSANYDREKQCLVLRNASETTLEIIGIEFSERLDLKANHSKTLAPQEFYETPVKLNQKHLAAQKDQDFLEETFLITYKVGNEVLKNRVKLNLISTDLLKSFAKETAHIKVDTPLVVEQSAEQSNKTAAVDILASGMIHLGEGRYRLELLLKNKNPEWNDIKLYLNGSVELIDQKGNKYPLKFDQNSTQSQKEISIEDERKITFEGYLENSDGIVFKRYRVVMPYTDEFVGDDQIVFEKEMPIIDIRPYLDISPTKSGKYLLTLKNNSEKNIILHNPYSSSSMILEKDTFHQIEIDAFNKDSKQKDNLYLFAYAEEDEPSNLKTFIVPLVYIEDINKKWWHWDSYGWKIFAIVTSVAVIVGTALYIMESNSVDCLTEHSAKPSTSDTIKSDTWLEDWALNTWGKRFKETLKIDGESFNTPYTLISDPNYKTNPSTIKQEMQKLFITHSLDVLDGYFEYYQYRNAVHKVTLQEIKKIINTFTGQEVDF